MPKLLMWASPHMTTGIPLTGSVEGSDAITHADPRRKGNGEDAMRPMRRGIRCACRPALLLANNFSGSGRVFPGVYLACDSIGTFWRSALPSALRQSAGSTSAPDAVAYQLASSPATGPC